MIGTYNKQEQPDYRTARILNEIANTLDDELQFTFDVPSENADGKLPVLDLAMWIENDQVTNVFYKKKVSSIFTVLKRSAVSNRTKLNTLFEEVMRRLYNISPNLPLEVWETHLSKFSQCMMISGYSEVERMNTIKGAITRYEDMIDKLKNGD